jgi:hypothetical protein
MAARFDLDERAREVAHSFLGRRVLLRLLVLGKVAIRGALVVLKIEVPVLAAAGVESRALVAATRLDSLWIALPNAQWLLLWSKCTAEIGGQD